MSGKLVQSHSADKFVVKSCHRRSPLRPEVGSKPWGHSIHFLKYDVSDQLQVRMKYAKKAWVSIEVPFQALLKGPYFILFLFIFAFLVTFWSLFDFYTCLFWSVSKILPPTNPSLRGAGLNRSAAAEAGGATGDWGHSLSIGFSEAISCLSEQCWLQRCERWIENSSMFDC